MELKLFNFRLVFGRSEEEGRLEKEMKQRASDYAEELESYLERLDGFDGIELYAATDDILEALGMASENDKSLKACLAIVRQQYNLACGEAQNPKKLEHASHNNGGAAWLNAAYSVIRRQYAEGHRMIKSRVIIKKREDELAAM